MSFRIARFLIRLFYRLVARIRVVGAENVPAVQGMVVVTNHIGRLDIGLPYRLVDRHDIIMLVAEKYREMAIVRVLAAAIDGIWVDRFNADFAAVRACLRRLAGGGVLVIAPEGTRSPTGNLQRARSGAGFLAAKAAVPIVPTAIRGTEDAVVKARLKRLRRVEVVVTFGQPFFLPPRPDLKAKARLQAFDDELMCRIAALLPPDRRGAYAEHPRLRELLAGDGSPAEVRANAGGTTWEGGPAREGEARG
jgi:1-acyl-sn-glycerol-3-phosphate acyltransferase